MDSLFDNFDGYYSVCIDGVEFARFAPSNTWTDFWNDNCQVNWSFKWVPNV